MMTDNFHVDLWNESVLSSRGIREEPKMKTLEECISYFIEADALFAMRKVASISRVTIFNQACRQAFVTGDTSEYADTLRAYAKHLDETGILPKTLEG